MLAPSLSVCWQLEDFTLGNFVGVSDGNALTMPCYRKAIRKLSFVHSLINKFVSGVTKKIDYGLGYATVRSTLVAYSAEASSEAAND